MSSTSTSTGPTSRPPRPEQFSAAAISDEAENLGATQISRPLDGLRRKALSVGGLVALAVRRLRYYRGLSALSLTGIVLAVALVTSNAFFAQAVDRVMLQRELAEYTRITGRPPFSARVFAPSSRTVPLTLERAETLGEHVADTVSTEVGLPVKLSVLMADSGAFSLMPTEDDTRYDSDRELSRVSLAYMEDVEAQLDIVDGIAMAEEAPPGGLPVWMPSALALELGVQPGERFLLNRSNLEGGLPMVLAGTWQATDPEAAYWPRSPETALQTTLLVRRSDYLAQVEPLLDVKVRTATWNLILDERRAVPALARDYKEGFDRAAIVLPRYLPEARLTAATNSFEKFVGQQTTLTTLLLGFNVPALVFLIYFLVLTSAVVAYWQRRETAVLRSRGVSRPSVLNITVTEQALLFVLGAPLGWALGLVLARLMGYAVSFLDFTSRPPLPVAMNWMSVRLTFLTLIVVLGAKLWTVAGSTNQTVVTQEREHARPTRAPFWYRNYLDLILIIPTIYLYRQLMQRGWLGALVQDKPGDLYQDPMMILLPGLFIVTLSLVTMRFFPVFVRVLDFMAGKLPAFTSYLALRQLSRQSQSYINPLLLVIVSLALGVYTVSMAASMDQWLQDRVYYSVGADLAFTPYIESDGGTGGGIGWIPVPDEFEALPEVAAAARAGSYRTEIFPSGAQGPSYTGRFLGIDRIDLPDAVWYRGDLSPESLGALMNRLAATPDGVLVSQEMLTENALRIGDRIHLLILPDVGLSIRDQFTVVGAYDNFPTVYPEEPAIIGNLEYVSSYFGVTLPHNILLDLRDGVSGDEALAAITENLDVEPIRVQDAEKTLSQEQAVMERIGVFGTLSVSFVAAAVMAAVGLLTYSYASLNERLFQFSVLRAIGLQRRQIVGQVALEYGILTVFGAVMGVLCGTAAASLFVPLFRVSSGPTAPLPPLVPVFAHSQIILLAILFAGLMILLELVVVSSTFRNNLFRTLRLGNTA